MQVKGSEPPDSPPPPYPGYAPHPPPQHSTHYGDQHGGIPEVYYPPVPGAAYPNYDPNQHLQQQQTPYSQQQQCQHYAQQQHPGVTSPRHVIITQPQSLSGGAVEMAVHRPQSYLALSMVTCLCFSPLFGLIAICFSAASHSAYEHGDVLSAKRHGTTALLLCIFGIVLSLVILVIVLTAGVQWKPD